MDGKEVEITQSRLDGIDEFGSSQHTRTQLQSRQHSSTTYSSPESGDRERSAHSMVSSGSQPTSNQHLEGCNAVSREQSSGIQRWLDQGPREEPWNHIGRSEEADPHKAEERGETTLHVEHVNRNV